MGVSRSQYATGAGFTVHPDVSARCILMYPGAVLKINARISGKRVYCPKFRDDHEYGNINEL